MIKWYWVVLIAVIALFISYRVSKRNMISYYDLPKKDNNNSNETGRQLAEGGIRHVTCNCGAYGEKSSNNYTGIWTSSGCKRVDNCI